MSAVIDEGMGLSNGSQTKAKASEEIEVRFGFLWCFLFFLLSGDKNRKIHGVFGKLKIVQGVAVVTKMGTIVSQLYPMYMVRRIGEITFKLPTRIGNSVTMTFSNFTEGRKGIATVTVSILQGGRQVIKPVELFLVPRDE